MVLIKRELRDKISKRLRTRLIIYFVISVLILGIAIFHIVKDQASLGLTSIGFFIGIIVGIIVSRMYKVVWDEHAAEVISTFDSIGIVFLVFYVAFEIFRERIVGLFIHGPSVVAVSFAILAGVMYGRVLGTRGKIRDIFKEQDLI